MAFGGEAFVAETAIGHITVYHRDCTFGTRELYQFMNFYKPVGISMEYLRVNFPPARLVQLWNTETDRWRIKPSLWEHIKCHTLALWASLHWSRLLS